MKRAVPVILALMFAFHSPATRAQSASPRKDIPSIAKAANRAIVTIITGVNDKPIALGTGFMVSADGVIVTNYHVIKTGNVAAAKFADGSVLEVDGVLAADKRSRPGHYQNPRQSIPPSAADDRGLCRAARCAPKRGSVPPDIAGPTRATRDRPGAHRRDPADHL